MKTSQKYVAPTKVDMSHIFPSTAATNQSTIQSMSAVNPDLIACFHSLQTFFLYAGFDDSKRLSIRLSAEVLRLVSELAKSMMACVERVEMENAREVNPSMDGKMQSDASRTSRMGVGQRAQERKMVYESRVLTAIAAICGHYEEVARAVLNLDGEQNEPAAGGASLIIVLVEVLAAIMNTVRLLARGCERIFIFGLE